MTVSIYISVFSSVFLVEFILYQNLTIEIYTRYFDLHITVSSSNLAFMCRNLHYKPYSINQSINQSIICIISLLCFLLVDTFVEFVLMVRDITLVYESVCLHRVTGDTLLSTVCITYRHEYNHLRHEYNHMRDEYNHLRHEYNHLRHEYNHLSYEYDHLRHEYYSHLRHEE